MKVFLLSLCCLLATVTRLCAQNPSQNHQKAMDFEVNMTKNPQTGKVEHEKTMKAQLKVQSFIEQPSSQGGTPMIPIPNVNWIEMGPKQAGGRVRSICYVSTKVFAGGVGGGLWYCDNPTSVNYK